MKTWEDASCKMFIKYRRHESFPPGNINRKAKSQNASFWGEENVF